MAGDNEPQQPAWPRPLRRRVGGDQIVPRPTTWTRGQSAPWGLALPLTAAAAAHAATSVDSAARVAPLTFPGARPSAVLVAMTDGPHGAEVLLTKRSAALRHHANEISFPGGRLDEHEDAVTAALREAAEEVGLTSESVTVRGQLSPLSTVVSLSFIVPVVATLEEHPSLVPHDREVARILWVPLTELANADTHREERWGTPPLDRPMDFFELDDETIWGVTARILRELLDRVYGPPATRTTL